MNRAQQELEIARAYRALFLNEDGTFVPDAEVIMRDLENHCGAHKKNMPTINDGSIDPMRIVENFAKVAVFRYVKERLFGPLDKWKREVEKEID